MASNFFILHDFYDDNGKLPPGFYVAIVAAPVDKKIAMTEILIALDPIEVQKGKMIKCDSIKTTDTEVHIYAEREWEKVMGLEITGYAVGKRCKDPVGMSKFLASRIRNSV